MKVTQLMTVEFRGVQYVKSSFIQTTFDTNAEGFTRS